MTRRTATLSLAAVLLVVLLGLALLRPVPFVTLSPGPTANTLGALEGHQIVRISGHKVYPTTGGLDLTTVRVTKPSAHVTLVDAISAWFDPHREVLPRDVIYPPEQSAAQAEALNAEEMQTSQQTAKVAALHELGFRTPTTVVVSAITQGAPALGHLQAGDEIVSVDGTDVNSPDAVGKALQQTQPGGMATFVVKRSGKTLTVQTPTQADSSDPQHTIVGISVSNGYALPFDITVDVGQRIGGPSAGTVFALAIYDKLTPGSLTGGATIAGTGEISVDGHVGQIGGIQQKIAGAAASGASIFLVPSSNCAEALDADVEPGDIKLVKVTTLHDAITSLTSLAADPNASVPAC
jgi:PDZ domain-containing protein